MMHKKVFPKFPHDLSERRKLHGSVSVNSKGNLPDGLVTNFNALPTKGRGRGPGMQYFLWSLNKITHDAKIVSTNTSNNKNAIIFILVNDCHLILNDK